MLTQERLKELLTYCPETGIFTRRIVSGSRGNIGTIAGSKHNAGYTRIGINNKDYLAHHLAFLYMKGYIPKEVDHIDNIRNNNTWSNLRECSRSQNRCNDSTVTGSVPIKGICIAYAKGKYPCYKASIKLHGKVKTTSYGWAKHGKYAALELASKWLLENRILIHKEFTNMGK